MSPPRFQLTGEQKDLLARMSASEPKEAFDIVWHYGYSDTGVKPGFRRHSLNNVARQLERRRLIKRVEAGWILTDSGVTLQTILLAETRRYLSGTHI